jgi:hypothetical protein
MFIWNYPDTALHPDAFAELADCPFCSVHMQRLFWDQRKSTSHNQDYNDLLGFFCPTCGWWKVIRETGIWGPPNLRYMPKFAYQKFCQAGCLKLFSQKPITFSLEDTCDYLKTHLPPGYLPSSQIDEEVVTRLLPSEGYEVVLASTTDLGMLAIMANEKENFGILFKPFQKTVKAWQLSALSGVLVRSATTKGVFTSVLTDDESVPSWGRPVELSDPLRLFDALNIAQIPKFSTQEDFLKAYSLNHMTRIKAYDGF